MNRPSYGHRVLRNVVLSGPSPAQTSSQRSSLKAATRWPTLRIRSSYSPACVPRRQDRGQHGAAQRKAVTVAKLAQAANAGRLAWLLTVQRSSRCADTLTPRRIGVALPRDPGSAEPTSSTCDYSPACVPRRQDRGQHGAAQRKAVTVAKLAQAANAGRLAWLLTVQRSSRCADTLTPRRIGVALPRDPGSAEPTSSTCNGRVKRHRDAEDGPIVCNRRECRRRLKTDPVLTGWFLAVIATLGPFWRLATG